MAQFKDYLPHPQGWIHEIARTELHPETERLFQNRRALDPQQLVEENTIDFLSQLRENFTEIARVFNSYSEKATRFPEVKIYSVAQTAADFMVFRNQVKLIVSNTAHGIIQLSFSKHHHHVLSVDGQLQNSQNLKDSGTLGDGAVGAQELVAKLGPFREVFWTYGGERVQAAQIAKFYFSEFVRVSRDVSRVKMGKEALLEQIKSLLKEQGVDL